MKINANLNFEQKLKILDDIAGNVTIKTISEKYKIHRSTVTRIRNDGERIREFANKSVIQSAKIKRLSNVAVPEIETALYQYFIKERLAHNIITDEVLQLKAMEFHKFLNTDITFQASHGWVQKFKKRHCIRLLKICGEKLSTNDSVVPEFIASFTRSINEQSLVPEQIYNCDESGLVYKSLHNRTLVSVNEKLAPGRKQLKDRLTVMPCCNSTGQHKFPLMIIGKSRNPRCFKDNTLPTMHYRSSKNAWQTRELFHEWFHDVFIVQVRLHLTKMKLPLKAVLLLDNASSHCIAEELTSEDGNIRAFFFPPNTTAILQPLDQGIIQSMKQTYRKKLLFNLVSQPGDTLENKLKKIDLKEVMFMITEAWAEVSHTTISNGFKHIFECPNNLAKIGCSSPSKDQGGHITIPDLYRRLLPDTDLHNGEISDWACGTHEKSGNLIIDDDIIEEVKEVPDEDNTSNAETCAEALKCINITINFAECNLSLEDILQLRKIREKIISIVVK